MLPNYPLHLRLPFLNSHYEVLHKPNSLHTSQFYANKLKKTAIPLTAFVTLAGLSGQAIEKSNLLSNCTHVSPTPP
jgi:hypothetical protein